MTGLDLYIKLIRLTLRLQIAYLYLHNKGENPMLQVMTSTELILCNIRAMV